MVNKKIFRYAIRFSIAIFLALIVNYFFSFSHEYLIPCAAVFTMLTPVGNTVAEGLKRFLLFALLTAVFSALLSSHPILYARIYDVFIGSAIGITVNLIIFPRKADVEFRSAILPMLSIYDNYFSAIIDFFMRKQNSNIDVYKIQLELQLQKLPVWVYKSGFDVGLQKGHRYFLGKIQQIAEILFAMHYVARHVPEKKIIKKMRAPLLECVNRIQALLKAFLIVFELKKLSEGVEDCQPELAELEKVFQTLLPKNLDLAAMPQNLVVFYEFIYGLKDLRNVLIQLAQALR